MWDEERLVVGQERQLRLHFPTPDAFATEYIRNVAQGGAFVPGNSSFELREVVRVVLELAYRGTSLELEAEVVHVVPPELAKAGGTAGVAVQFLKSGPELREMLSPYAEDALHATSLRGEGTGEKEEPEALSWEWDESVDVEALHRELDLDGLDFGPESEGGDESPPASDASAPVESDSDPGFAPDFDPSLRDLGTTPLDSPARKEWKPRARRAITRVHARLRTPDGVLEGRTRDISHSGVAVSVDGSNVPVGTSLALTLTDPLSGASLEVPARVARHLEGEGTVAGLGLQFELPDERRAEITSFLDQLWRRDRARRLGGIRGDVAEVGAVNLLQMLGHSAPCGTLTMTRSSQEAIVAFERGVLRYARLGPASGVKALARMLAWNDGAFEFHAHVDPLQQEDPPVPLEHCLLEALHQVDEVSRLDGVRPDPAARLRLVAERAEAARGELGDLELAVLELAGARVTLGRVLDVIPEPDAEILRSLESLRQRGILIVDPA